MPETVTSPSSSPVVAEVVRGGVVEGRHHGSAVAVDPAGAVTWSLGDPDALLLPRSCVKPLQALAMVRSGLDLPPDLLALAGASHSGEQVHLDGVHRILAGAGLDESVLQTPEDWPFDDEEKAQWLREGRPKARIAMNCSGKHAAMLATCVVNGWPTASYLEPEHPLQQAVRATIAELTGVPVEVSLVDGCGAPLLGTTLAGLARAFGRIAGATDGPEKQVADAVRAHPENVSGTRRDEARLVRAVPGSIAKSGAEACYAIGLPDGRGVALKIEDGTDRARPVVMARALALLGVTDEPGVDAAAVEDTGTHVLLGGGHPVGGVRAAF